MTQTNPGDQIRSFNDFPQLSPLAPESPILELEDFLGIFKMFSDPTRIVIVRYLYEHGRTNENELVEHVGKSGNSLHYHVRKLVQAGVVTNTRRETRGENGVHSYYELTDIGESAARHTFAIFTEQRDIVEGSLEEQEAEQTSSLGTELSSLLTSSNDELQNWAVSSLADLAELNPDAIVDSVGELEALLDDDQLSVRNQAAKALFAIGETAPELLPADLSDRIQSVATSIQPANVDSIGEFIQFADTLRKLSNICGDLEQSGDFSVAIATIYARLSRQEQHSALENNTDFDSADAAFLEAVRLFERADAIDSASKALQKLGRYFIDQQQYENAIAQLAQAEQYAEDAENDELIVDAKITRGYAHKHAGEEAEADALFEEANQLAADIGYRRAEVITLLQRAMFERTQVLQEETADTDVDEVSVRSRFEEAKNIAESEELDLDIRRKVTFELGVTNGLFDNPSAAAEYFEQSRQIAQELDEPGLVAVASENAGLAYSALGNVAQAREAYLRALESYSEADPEVDQTKNSLDVLQKLASLMKESKENTTAIEYCEQGLEQIEALAVEHDDGEESLPQWANEQKRWFNTMIAVIRDDRRTLEAVYHDALGCLQHGQADEALDILRDIWRLREECDSDSEIYQLILQSGVGMMGCMELLELPGKSEVQAYLDDEISQLGRPARLLFRWLSEDNLETEVLLEELESFISDPSPSLNQQEASAFRQLVLDLRNDELMDTQRPDDQTLLNMDSSNREEILG